MVRTLALLVALLVALLWPTGSYGPVERPDLGEAWLSAQRFVESLNLERSRHGLAPVRYDSGLTGLAALISVDNAGRAALDHTDGMGRSFLDRIRARAIHVGPYTVAWEVLTAPPDGHESAALRDWLDSPAHRAAVLSPRARRVGYYQATRLYRSSQGWHQRYRWCAAVLAD